MKYFTGCKPDPLDARDHRRAAPPTATLPAFAVVSHPGRITNQGDTNSCTGHAIAYFWAQILASRAEFVGALSPLYTWFWARKAEGVSGRNEGVTLRSSFAALKEYGCPPADCFTSTGFTAKPDTGTEAYGRALRLPEYVRLETLRDIQYSIAVEDQSVVLGTTIFADWMSGETERTGIVNYDPMTPTLDGHALVIVGYDNASKRLRCANSWGVNYGDGGYLSLPYDFVTRERSDLWTASYDALPGKA